VFDCFPVGVPSVDASSMGVCGIFS
jgi:hypothetical protein